jgi:hypothetical protein
MANGISLRAGKADQNVVRGAQQKAQQQAQAAKRSAERLSKTTDAFTKNFQAGLQAGMRAKAIKSKEVEGYENTIKQNSNNLLKSGYSLGEGYYNQTKSQVQDIRNRYTEAKKAGNEEEADKILLELNLLSDGVAQQKSSIKTNMELVNEYIEDENFETNLSSKQKEIVSMFTESNAVIDKETNSFKYKNTNYDASDKSKGPEFYTVEDLESNIPIVDHKTIESYAKSEVDIVEAGMKYKRGEGKGFDVELRSFQNKKMINKDNIQGLMNNQDIFQGMSFSDGLENNPEIQSILNKNLEDKNKDGVVNWKDFAKTEEEGLQKLKDAIIYTDDPNYNFETSKNLLAEFMTLRQQKLFSGDDNQVEYTEGMSRDDYLAAGGNIGKLKDEGYFVNKDGKIIKIPGRTLNLETTTLDESPLNQKTETKVVSKPLSTNELNNILNS